MVHASCLPLCGYVDDDMVSVCVAVCYKTSASLDFCTLHLFVDTILSFAIFVPRIHFYIFCYVSCYFFFIIIQTQIRMKFKLENRPTFKRVLHIRFYIPFVCNGLTQRSRDYRLQCSLEDFLIGIMRYVRTTHILRAKYPPIVSNNRFFRARSRSTAFYTHATH